MSNKENASTNPQSLAIIGSRAALGSSAASNVLSPLNSVLATRKDTIPAEDFSLLLKNLNIVLPKHADWMSKMGSYLLNAFGSRGANIIQEWIKMEHTLDYSKGRVCASTLFIAGRLIITII
jgi:hypothetical protein